MKKITCLLAFLSISAFAQEQFPGEHEGNLIHNAGFEEEPAWGNNTNNDNWGWECWGCIRAENESLQGSKDDNNDWRIPVPAAGGSYFGLSRPWEGTMFQVFEIKSNTQYTVKLKFGWIHYFQNYVNSKSVNIVVNNNMTGSDKVIFNKFSIADNNFFASDSSNGFLSGLFFDSWRDIEFTFTTDDNSFDGKFSIWTPNATPIYIIDNVEVFPTPAASINKFKNVDFKFSPNPTTDVLNLSASKNISSIQIYNSLGQKVMDKNINALSSKVNIASLKTGIYFLHASIDGATETYKFQKI